jgi:hypothetical protein
LERVSRNIAYCEDIIDKEADDEDLLNNIARLQDEYITIVSYIVKLEEKRLIALCKSKKHSNQPQNKQKKKQSALF